MYVAQLTQKSLTNQAAFFWSMWPIRVIDWALCEIYIGKSFSLTWNSRSISIKITGFHLQNGKCDGIFTLCRFTFYCNTARNRNQLCFLFFLFFHNIMHGSCFVLFFILFCSISLCFHNIVYCSCFCFFFCFVPFRFVFTISCIW